jgi:hypothetical protein
MTTRSISDDDLCADCTHCGYQPGDSSTCAKDWPGIFDQNGYCVSCVSFIPILKWGDNIPESGTN